MRRHAVQRVKNENKNWIQGAIKKKGSFSATMKRTGKSAAQLSHSKNRKTRRRAILAMTLAKLRKKK